MYIVCTAAYVYYKARPDDLKSNTFIGMIAMALNAIFGSALNHYFLDGRTEPSPAATGLYCALLIVPGYLGFLYIDAVLQNLLMFLPPAIFFTLVSESAWISNGVVGGMMAIAMAFGAGTYVMCILSNTTAIWPMSRTSIDVMSLCCMLTSRRKIQC